jgi:hypothetical protein
LCLIGGLFWVVLGWVGLGWIGGLCWVVVGEEEAARATLMSAHWKLHFTMQTTDNV